MTLFRSLKAFSSLRDLYVHISGVQFIREPNPDCCLCHPSAYHTVGSEEEFSSDSLCSTCLVSIQQAYQLTKASSKV